MAWCDGSAEDGHRVLILDEDDAEPVGGGVALDNELLGEVRKMHHRQNVTASLRASNSTATSVVQRKPSLCRRVVKGAVVAHELAVVSRDAQESPHSPSRAWLWPVTDHLHLGGIHRHAIGGDDVPQVLDGVDVEGTLGALDVELVMLKGGEDNSEVVEVHGPGAVVDEDVVEEDEDEAAEEWAKHLVHQGLEHGRGVAETEGHD